MMGFYILAHFQKIFPTDIFEGFSVKTPKGSKFLSASFSKEENLGLVYQKQIFIYIFLHKKLVMHWSKLLGSFYMIRMPPLGGFLSMSR